MFSLIVFRLFAWAAIIGVIYTKLKQYQKIKDFIQNT